MHIEHQLTTTARAKYCRFRLRWLPCEKGMLFWSTSVRQLLNQHTICSSDVLAIDSVANVVVTET
jgi:hypothetical protein